MPYDPTKPLDFFTNQATLQEYLEASTPLDKEEKMIIKTLGAEGLRLQEKQQGKGKEGAKQIRMEL